MRNHLIKVFTPLFLLTAIIFSGSFLSCQKDNDTYCETVVNEHGPAFLKVINNLNEEIFVDLTSIIPLGAHVRSGACELYGLPKGSHSIEISKNDGAISKEIDFSLGDSDTFEVIVGSSFF